MEKVEHEYEYEEYNNHNNEESFQTRNAKQVSDHDASSANSLLDTINLSYAGNMDLANAVEKVKYGCTRFVNFFLEFKMKF